LEIFTKTKIYYIYEDCIEGNKRDIL